MVKNKQKIQNIDEFVDFLAEIRKLRGELISLKELRYVKPKLVEEYEEKIVPRWWCRTHI